MYQSISQFTELVFIQNSTLNYQTGLGVKSPNFDLAVKQFCDMELMSITFI